MATVRKRKKRQKRPKDLAGMRFGRLTVVRFDHCTKWGEERWMCQCDCGKTKVRGKTSLFHGHTESCGCAKGEKQRRLNYERMQRVKAETVFVDLAGQRFGRLIVVRPNGMDKVGFPTWACLCECGNTAIVRAYSLKSGSVKSCGCLKSVPAAHRESGRTARASYRSYRKAADGRQIPFELSAEAFGALVSLPCHYCGAEPIENGVCGINGVDRIDNLEGYTESNVVPCCKACNFAKSTKSVHNFAAWIAKAYTHFAAHVAAQGDS